MARAVISFTFMRRALRLLVSKMRVSSDGRYFVHEYPSHKGPDETLWRETVESTMGTMKSSMLVELQRQSRKDGLYTGRLGIIYALHETGSMPWDVCSDFIGHRLSVGRGTFLQSDMYAAILNANKKVIDECVETVSSLPESECELLYGRAGCISGLLLAKTVHPSWDLDVAIATLASEVVQAGRRADSSTLMWEWHGKQYLGAIHGVAGILYVLLCCGRDILLRVEPSIYAIIEQTAADVLRHSTSAEGNIASSVESASDRLVHFCHGATGWIPLMCLMHTIYGSKRYLEQASSFGDVLWKRGLLATKGPGICHGVGGGICAFIDLYCATGDREWLNRAQWFSLFLCEHWEALAQNADAPLSLFEGVAGAFYALAAVRDSKEFSSASPHGFHGSCFPGLKATSLGNTN
jgi:hypothetical protein